jgi:uncharacterized protein YukE
MADGAFPDRPRGEAGGIEAAASDLQNAARELTEGGTNMRSTGSALLGGDWSGQAAGRFGSASSGLSTAYHAAAETLTGCAKTLRDYAHVLASSQRTIDAAKIDYDQANSDLTSAQGALTGLGNLAVSPHPPKDIDARLSAASSAVTGAQGRAHDALIRAQHARTEFDRASSRAVSELSGQSPMGAPGLGAPGHGFIGSDPFTGVGTGGLGSIGGGFGVPVGGLSAYNGVARVADLTGEERSAYGIYEDATHPVEATGDLTNLVLFAFGGGEAKIGETVLGKIGVRLAEDGGEKVVATVPRKFLSDELTEMGAKTSINGLGREDLESELGALGVPQQYRGQVVKSFEDHTAHVRVAGDDSYVYRFHGGASPDKSFYASPTFDQGAARARSALPPGNTMEHISQFRLKPGTPYVEGRIAPNFGQPGGGVQYYVPNPDDLIPVK